MPLRENATALTLIDAHAARDPAHCAVIFEDRVLSYGELVAASTRLAGTLVGHGIGAGDRVSMIASNNPDYYIAYLAVLRCGAALFPINTDLTLDEVSYIIGKTDPALVIADEALHARASEAIAALERKPVLMRLEHLQAEARTQVVSGEFPKRSGDDIALVVHTSGTTARPKGVVASDRMEIRSACALGDYWDLRPGDISVCALPLSYTFGLFSASFTAFCAGASVLLFPKFHPVRVLEGIERHRASYMVGVPTMYSMMLEHVTQTGRRHDLSSVRMMAASGAPITLKTKEDFRTTFGVTLRDYYALSECTPIFSFDLRSESGSTPPPGSVGQLVQGAEVTLLGDIGRPQDRFHRGRERDRPDARGGPGGGGRSAASGAGRNRQGGDRLPARSAA